MKNSIIILVLLLIQYLPQLYAEDVVSRDNKELKYTFSQFGRESLDFITQPANWDAGDYLKIGMLSAGTIALMFVDEPIRNAAQKDQRYYKSAPMIIGQNYGSIYSPIAFFSGFALYSLIFDDMKARKIGFEIGQAALYAGAITYIVKYGVGRGRPNIEQGPASYKPFDNPFNEDYHSFPGGHSTAAFAISTVLAKNVDSYWLKALIYVPAVMTSTSRVYQNWHWTSDNFTGAALGIIVGSWVVNKHEIKVNKDTKQSMLNSIQLEPVITSSFVGLNLSMIVF